MKRAWYYGSSKCVMGIELTGDIEEVNAEDRVCHCNACANGAVSSVM